MFFEVYVYNNKATEVSKYASKFIECGYRQKPLTRWMH